MECNKRALAAEAWQAAFRVFSCKWSVTFFHREGDDR